MNFSSNFISINLSWCKPCGTSIRGNWTINLYFIFPFPYFITMTLNFNCKLKSAVKAKVLFLDIFSSFDTKISLTFTPLVTVIVMGALLVYLRPIFLNNKLIVKFMVMISQSITQTRAKNFFPISLIMLSIFTIVFLLNIFRLNSYFFPLSSHLLLSLALALPLWVLTVVSPVIQAPIAYGAALLPSGAPLWLAPILSIIELVRVFIRPITLPFRLTANITAGHVILGLIASIVSNFLNNGAIIFLIFLLRFYLVFEIIICFIQAFIFSLLTSIYTNDHSCLYSLLRTWLLHGQSFRDIGVFRNKLILKINNWCSTHQPPNTNLIGNWYRQ